MKLSELSNLTLRFRHCQDIPLEIAFQLSKLLPIPSQEIAYVTPPDSNGNLVVTFTSDNIPVVIPIDKLRS